MKVYGIPIPKNYSFCLWLRTLSSSIKFDRNTKDKSLKLTLWLVSIFLDTHTNFHETGLRCSFFWLFLHGHGISLGYLQLN